MNNKERAAMQQALDALHYAVMASGGETGCNHEFNICFCKENNAISALREALAEQAEQEPVGVIGWAANIPNTMEEVHWEDECPPIGTTLYAAPVRTKDLTDAVDAAMVEMQNIHPPLRRSECERLIRAANYAAPVRTKDLTDDEIAAALKLDLDLVTEVEFRDARAVIAADREKNK